MRFQPASASTVAQAYGATPIHNRRGQRVVLREPYYRFASTYGQWTEIAATAGQLIGGITASAVERARRKKEEAAAAAAAAAYVPPPVQPAPSAGMSTGAVVALVGGGVLLLGALGILAVKL